MIQTKNAEVDAIIAALTEQRNAAMDSVAILSAKLGASEQFAKGLQEQLEQALKPKEGEA